MSRWMLGPAGAPSGLHDAPRHTHAPLFPFLAVPESEPVSIMPHPVVNPRLEDFQQLLAPTAWHFHDRFGGPQRAVVTKPSTFTATSKQTENEIYQDTHRIVRASYTAYGPQSPVSDSSIRLCDEHRTVQRPVRWSVSHSRTVGQYRFPSLRITRISSVRGGKNS